MPYFIYDIYAMFLCHWHKHQVKGHGGDGEARAPGSTWAVARGYLHKEFLMVLHHAVMVLVCFPLSVVSQGADSWGPVRGMPHCGARLQRAGGPRVEGPRQCIEHQSSPRQQEGHAQQWGPQLLRLLAPSLRVTHCTPTRLRHAARAGQALGIEL